MNLSRRLEGSRPRGPSVVLAVRGTRTVSNRSRETRSLCHDYALTTMLSPTRWDERWTDLEREVVRGSRWWSQRDLIATDEQVFPEDLADMLAEAGVW
jgi:hypothetical protein